MTEEQFSRLIDDGFEVRGAKVEDLEMAVPMFNLAEAELSGAGDWTVDRYKQEWLQTGIDLESSTRIVFSPDGEVVGCVELWDLFNPPARPWIWGRVHPGWKSQGIGSAMLSWALDTSWRALKRLPSDARLAPNTATPSSHTPTIDLFESMGMSVCRYSWRMITELDRPVPRPKWPEGIRIRTLRYPEDLEAVFLVGDEAFQEHWGYIKSPFEEAYPRWKKYNFDAQKLKPELWFLAVEGEQIAGYINCQERSDLDANIGWIPTLCVRKAYRRKGLGQGLLEHAFRELQTRGVSRVGLGVDAKNKTGATRLYQRVGMHLDQEMLHYEIELRSGRELAVTD